MHLRWYEKPVRILELNFEDPYSPWLDRWTGKDFIDIARGIGANVVVPYVFNMWYAYYNSKVFQKDLKLKDRDLVREMVEEAHKHGIKLVGMMGPSWLQTVYEHHPEWARKDIGGNISGWGATQVQPSCVILCVNSPFGDIVLEAFRELITDYDIDGVMFDGWIHRNCFCDYCQVKYKQKFGIDIPKKKDWSDPNWRRFFKWSREDEADFLKRTHDLIKSIKPDAIVALNHGIDLRNTASVTRDVDVIWGETNAQGQLLIPPSVGVMIRNMIASTKKPVWVTTVQAHYFYIALPKTPQHTRAEMHEAIISGGSPVITGWDWEFVKDENYFDPAKKVFEEVKNNEEYFIDTEPFKLVALLVSEQTKDWYAKDKSYLYFDHISGFYEALTAAHIPIDVLPDGNITVENLSKYRVLILANAACLSKAQTEAIRTFVKNGGGLVATYETSLYDEEGLPNREFALTDVLHCECVGYHDAPWSYIGISKPHMVTDGFELGFTLVHGDFGEVSEQVEMMRNIRDKIKMSETFPTEKDSLDQFLVRGISADGSRQVKVKALEGFEIVATVFETFERLGSSYVKDVAPPLPGRDTGYPAILVGTYGKGSVVYLAGQLDRLYHRYGHPNHEKILLNAVKWAIGGRLPVKIEGPITLESSLFEQKQMKRIIVHLLNHSYNQLYPCGEKRQGTFSFDIFRPIRTIVPIADVRVGLEMPNGLKVDRVYSMLTNEEIAWKQEQSTLSFTVKKLDEYDAYVIKYS